MTECTDVCMTVCFSPRFNGSTEHRRKINLRRQNSRRLLKNKRQTGSTAVPLPTRLSLSSWSVHRRVHVCSICSMTSSSPCADRCLGWLLLAYLCNPYTSTQTAPTCCRIQPGFSLITLQRLLLCNEIRHPHIMRSCPAFFPPGYETHPTPTLGLL